MKLLYVIDTLEYGGSEKSLLDLVTHLKKTESVVFHIYEGDALKQEFEKKGIRVISGNLKKKHGYGTAVRKTLSLIRKEKPDLIHTTLARSNFTGRICGKISNTPVISSFVNDSYSEARMLRTAPSLRKKLKVVQFFDRWTCRYVSHFIANSQATKEANCKSLRLKSDRVTVLYRGRDPGLFDSQNSSSDDLRKSLGIPEDVPVILNVGRLHPQKGQEDLLRGMQILLRTMNAHLLIAGEGPLRRKLAVLITSLALEGCVTLLGARNDVPALLKVANVFAFPSYYEGHPGALVEAMFAAQPILASDIPVHRETISHGNTGYLTPVGAPELLANGLLSILKNPDESRRIGQQARQAALKQFHIDIIAGLYEDLYQKILTEQR